MPKLPIPEQPISDHVDILNTVIQNRKLDRPLPSTFLEVIEDLKHTPVVAQILLLWEVELQDKIKKLSYAKLVLTDEIYDEVGEEWIMAPGMTLDKICTIGIGEAETVGLMDWGLTIEHVKKINWKWLAHPKMTVEKLTLLCFWATPEQIQEIWAEKIVNMSEDDLSELLIF